MEEKQEKIWEELYKNKPLFVSCSALGFALIVLICLCKDMTRDLQLVIFVIFFTVILISTSYYTAISAQMRYYENPALSLLGIIFYFLSFGTMVPLSVDNLYLISHGLTQKSQDAIEKAGKSKLYKKIPLKKQLWVLFNFYR